jgi:prefoldin subunit 5
MNITQKIADLEKQKEAFEKTKAEAHEAIKEITAKIGKLKTIAKHAQELFEEKEVEKILDR